MFIIVFHVEKTARTDQSGAGIKGHTGVVLWLRLSTSEGQAIAGRAGHLFSTADWTGPSTQLLKCLLGFWCPGTSWRKG